MIKYLDVENANNPVSVLLSFGEKKKKKNRTADATQRSDVVELITLPLL